MSGVDSLGRHVFLVGFMGAGKSTVGRLLADSVGLPFVDLDAQVERDAGIPVSRIFEERGEVAFRDLESAQLSALEGVSPSVIACGGGIVLRDDNRRLLKQMGTVVYLQVGAGEALARIGDVEGRPLLASGAPSAAATLLKAREGLYSAVADVTLDTSGRTPESLARSVAVELGLREGVA